MYVCMYVYTWRASKNKLILALDQLVSTFSERSPTSTMLQTGMFCTQSGWRHKLTYETNGYA